MAIDDYSQEINISDPAYWNFRIRERFISGFGRLPPQEFAYAFNSNILAASILIEGNLPPTWRYGGSLWQNALVGIPHYRGVRDVTGKVDLFVNKSTLVIFPKFGESYEITYAPPKWFKDVELVVYEYIG